MTGHRLYDAVLFIEPEYEHRHLVLQAEDGCRQVHCGQLLIDYFLDGNLNILDYRRIYLRIAVIDAVDGLCQKHGVRLDLNGS